MAAALLSTLGPIVAQFLPSIMSAFGGKGGSGAMQKFGDMAKGVVMPFGQKILGRGVDWITKKFFGPSNAEEIQVEEPEENYQEPKKKQRRKKSYEAAPRKKVKQEPMELEGEELQNMYNEEQIPTYNPNYGAAGKYVYEKGN